MDLRQLRIFQVPFGYRAAIFCLLLAPLALATLALAWPEVFPADDRAALLQGAAYFFATSVPLLALALLLSGRTSARRAWETRTRQVFLDLLPDQLSRIDLAEHDPSEGLQPYSGKPVRLPRAQRRKRPMEVSVKLTTDGSTAYYRLYEPVRALDLLLSVDLKPRQATVCVRVPARQVDWLALRARVESTIAGAKASGGYTVDEEPRCDRVRGVDHHCLVFRRTEHNDELVWNASENHAFAVDLGLMVASFLRDAAELLARAPDPPAASASASASG